MNLICAWCYREGKYGDLSEWELLQDPSSAHGICARHEAQILPALSSLSFPDIELLVIVHRHDEALFDYLQPRFAGVRGVQVILERRESDRRRESNRTVDDRPERRLRQGQASPLGYTMVRFRRK